MAAYKWQQGGSGITYGDFSDTYWTNKETGEKVYQAPQEWTDTYNSLYSKYSGQGLDAGFASAYTNAEMKGLTNIQQRDIQLTPTMTSRLQGFNTETGKWESAMDVGQMDPGTSFGDFALTSALLIGSVYAGGALAGAEIGAAAGGATGAGLETTAALDAISGAASFTGAGAGTAGSMAGLEISSLSAAAGSVGAGAAAADLGITGAGETFGMTGFEGAASSGAAATASAASGLSGAELLLASQAAPMLMGLAAGGPEMPESAGAASQDMGAKPERNPSTANKERAMELRRAAAERAANAAGAKRFKNESDLLGQTGRTTQRKRAGQQRAVLGY